MEREIVRYLLEQIYGRFSFYKLNGAAIEAKVASSGSEFIFFEKDIKDLINYLLKNQC